MFFEYGDATLIENLRLALSYLYQTAFVWLPIVTGIGLFHAWVGYKRYAYWQKLGSIVLEVKLPREIFKSPRAMEVVLGTLHQTADEGNWYWKYWLGQTRSWFSLEIASIGGNVRFFIWSRRKYKPSIEAHLYSQYPGIEVYEVEDYTLPYDYDPERNNFFACEWALTKADPYPIKTYVDYGLDKDPKEEYKIDPMSSALEFLGSITEGHNIFVQIMIRAHKKEQRKMGSLFGKTDAWKDEQEKEVKTLIEKFRPEDKDKQSRQPTEGERETIAALERSVSKFPFDVGIRTIYFADKDKYNSSYLGGMLNMFKQYGSLDLNGFKSTAWSSSIGAPWQGLFGIKEKIKRLFFIEYKLRRYFFSPYKGNKYFNSKPFVLNAEELATIYHFPGQVVTTPTLERIPSKKSEAPSNLPT
jgi:hypothetical protein